MAGKGEGPATVMEELVGKGIILKISWETSSPEPSLSGQVSSPVSSWETSSPEPSPRGQVSSPVSSRSIRRQAYPSRPSRSIRRQAYPSRPSRPSRSIRRQAYTSRPSRSIRRQAYDKQDHLDPSRPSRSIRRQAYDKQDHLDPSPPSRSIRRQAYDKQDHLDPSRPSRSIRRQAYDKQDHLDPSRPSRSIRRQAYDKQDHLDPSPPSRSIRRQAYDKQDHLDPSPPSRSIRRQAYDKQDHSSPSQSIRTQAHRKQDHLDPLPPSQSIGRQAHREQVHHDRPLRSQSILQKKFADCYLNHEHELELKMSNKRFTCDGCKEDGFNSRYRCKGCDCDFDLHEECKSPKSTIVPDLLERYTFEFSPKPPPDDDQRFCDGCGRNINGFFYHCKANGLNLHPCCAKLKAQVRNGETILQLRKNVSSNCMWCKKKKPPGADRKVGGWSYVSECEEYNIHIHCVTQILHEAWQKGAMTVDDESSMALEAIDLQRMAIPKGKVGGKGRAKKFLKIIGIFRTIVGILFGDPTVFLGSMMVEVLKQLL